MRILHVLNGAIGGASISTLDLVQGLAAREHESFIYCSARVSAEARAEITRRSPVPVHFGPLYFWNLRTRKPRLLRPLIEAYQLAYTRGLWRSSTQIMRVCCELKIDLIHSATALAPDGALAACRLGLPQVWHVREMIGMGQLHRLRGDAAGQAATRFLRTGQVIANSESSYRSFFGSEAPRDGATVIHNGFDFSRLPAALPPPFTAGRLHFGMVANLSSTWKRHADFLHAAALVAAALPTAQFRLYGEIPAEQSGTEARSYYRSLRSLVTELGLEDRVVFCGYQPDVGQVMAELDVVVHASEAESFGRVFVEASACGRVLIAARGGAAAEIIRHGETGVLVPPADIAALAAAMQAAAAQPQQSLALAAAAQRHVRRHYALDACCARIEQVYAEAADQARRGPGAQGFAAALLRTVA